MKYVLFTILTFLIIGSACSVAYGHKTVNVEQYEIEVGWQIEPPIVGFRNAITFEINEIESESVKAGVTNAFKNLEATVKFGGITKTLDINSDPRPGHYFSDIIPTRTGTIGIDLQGEASPALREKGTWNIVDLATTTFGQGIAVTPIQMIRAAGAIANHGVLMAPKIVEKIEGEGWEETNKGNVGQRVISAEAASEITAMMAEAASHGESKWTNLRGFKVAGKTGTAQIPIAGHYDAEKTNASFVGFAPYDNPKFIMLVILSEPQSSQWASETAAPLWYAIAKDLFPYLGIQPEG